MLENTVVLEDSARERVPERRRFQSREALVIGAVSLPVVAAGIFIVLRIRRKPKDKEKRRRLEVNSNGRLADATITDITDDAIFYEYFGARHHVHCVAGHLASCAS